MKDLSNSSLLGVPPRKRLKMYVAGPMTGREHYNADEFERVKAEMTKRGYEVVTPLDLNSEVWEKHHDVPFDPRKDKCDWGDPMLEEMLMLDLKATVECDVICLLEGWEQSKGARLEALLAHNLGKIFVYADNRRFYPHPTVTWIKGISDKDAWQQDGSVRVTAEQPEKVSESVGQEAHRLVRGNRNADYGHPLDDYELTGTMWSAMLTRWLRKLNILTYPAVLPPIPPHLGTLMMAVMKVSREVHRPKRDNRVDICGYTECADWIVDETVRRAEVVG